MPFGPIQGNLPFADAGSSMFQGLGGSPQQAFDSLGASYASAYKNALAMNQANYSNVLKGYQDTMAGQTSAQDAISRGYTDLTNNVLGVIQGVGQSQQQAINDQYAQATGQLSQNLVSRGLNNTTVAPNLQRGVEFDRAKASNDLAGTIAQLRGSYMSQLGQAGLGFDERAYLQNAGLAQNQLGWMNSVNAPYPNAGLYSQLAMQYGQVGQANQDRAQAAQQFAALQQAARPGSQMQALPQMGGAVGGGGSSGGMMAMSPVQGAGGPALTGAGGGSGPQMMFRPSATGADFNPEPMGTYAGALAGGGIAGLYGTGQLPGTPAEDPEMSRFLEGVGTQDVGIDLAGLGSSFGI